VTRWAQGREVREMRDADTILAIIRERGGRGLPLEGVYRQLYNPALYLPHQVPQGLRKCGLPPR
jgi:hypothetical protein